jgi:PAS domain S-box-containing protein
MARAEDPASQRSIPISAGLPAIDPESLALLVASVREYAIFLLAPDGTIRSWNAGAERIKGYREEEIIGRHFSVFYSEDEVEAGKPDAELETALREGGIEDEGWRLRKDGSRFWANVVITPLFGDDGTLRGFAKVTRDVTDRKEADEARDRFIANAAHELRTPLTVLVGMVSFLRSSPEVTQGDALPAHLETLGRQADRMHSLVNNLLDLTKLEQGRDIFTLSPIPLTPTFERLLVAFPPPPGKHVVRDPGDYTVLAEARRLEQVLGNLLVNAYRYGGSFIVMRAWDEGDAIAIKVQDDGPGVEPTLGEHVFEPFRRGQSSSAVDGSGLGLAIVRGFVESFGGTVALDRTAEGARFVVRLQKASG